MSLVVIDGVCLFTTAAVAAVAAAAATTTNTTTVWIQSTWEKLSNLVHSYMGICLTLAKDVATVKMSMP